MPDLSEIMGAGMTGAKLGAPAGLWGAAIGGVVGIGADLLFGGKKKPPEYVDPNKGMIDGQMYRLLQNNIGDAVSNRLSSKAQRNALLARQAIGNRPGMTNAGVLADMYDSSQRNVEGATIDANITGAQINDQNHARAIALSQQQGQRDLSIWDMNRQLRERPNFLQQVGMEGTAAMVGQGIGSGNGDPFGLKGILGNDGGGQNPSSPSATSSEAMPQSPMLSLAGIPGYSSNSGRIGNPYGSFGGMSGGDDGSGSGASSDDN